MFHGALGTTGLPLYCCLAAAAQALFLELLAGKSWFSWRRWPGFSCVRRRFLAWGGLGPFGLELGFGYALPLGDVYGVNKILWFWDVYPCFSGVSAAFCSTNMMQLGVSLFGWGDGVGRRRAVGVCCWLWPWDLLRPRRVGVSLPLAIGEGVPGRPRAAAAAGRRRSGGNPRSALASSWSI